jgi:hypothetical protein
VHKNVRLSELIVSAILDSDHLPVYFHLLDHIITKKLSDPVDKIADWEWLQSLTSELISPKFEIGSGEKAHNAAREFTASMVLAYRLSTRKITLSGLNKDLPVLESLIKHRRRLRKLESNPGFSMQNGS